jgi:hypothetical protein
MAPHLKHTVSYRAVRALWRQHGDDPALPSVLPSSADRLRVDARALICERLARLRM